MIPTSSFRVSTLLLGVVALVLVSCRKDHDADLEDQLPAVTIEGRNVFACVLNNKSVYNVTGAYESPSMAIGSQCRGGSSVGGSSHDLTISSRDCPSVEWHFEITVRDSAKIGQIFFGDGYQNDFRLTHTIGSGAGYNALEFYGSDGGGDGVIEFLRVDDRVCAGTFSFNLIEEHSGQSFSITNGRFDIAID